MKKIVFVAGDKSGDLYAGLLCKVLKERYKDALALYSFGGPVLAQHSLQPFNLVDLSVSGLVEVISHFRQLARAFGSTVKKIHALNPDLVILVDFPDFNLRLAQKLKPRFTLFYYVSPQIWAWRHNRIHTIKKYIDKMIVLFEFEQKLYTQAHIDTHFFGHPLLDIVRSIHAAPHKLILFLPGSRKNEIKRHLPLMHNVKLLLAQRLPDFTFKIVRPESIPKRFYRDIIGDALEIVLHSYETIAQAQFIITASGTATLELAILGVPFSILYKVNPLTWFILKHIVHTHFIGLPNIVSGEKIVEEFIQTQANPKKVATHTLNLMCSKDEYENIKQKIQKVKDKLIPYNALQNTAAFIGNYLGLTSQD